MRKYTQCKEDLDRLQELDPTWITVPANKARYSKIEKAGEKTLIRIAMREVYSAEEQFEREKEEMMGKLKDLGNTVRDYCYMCAQVLHITGSGQIRPFY